MVLGCLRLETQSTTTGLMAKHCYTASLLSMVSHFASVPAPSSHVLDDDVMGGKWKMLKSKYGLHAGCICMALTLLGDSHPLAIYSKGTVKSQ